MSEQETEEEPSIEEILTSIRQIISDDDEEAAGDEAPVDEFVAEPEPEDVENEPEVVDEPVGVEPEDIVELTDKIEDAPEDEPEAELEPEEKPIEVEMQDRELEEDAEPDDEADEVDAAEIEDFPSQDDEEDDSLLTNAAENAAFDAFSELAKKTAIQHGGITVEEIVRSELRPLLKGWLDKHLPSIIERLVQEELERVAKRAMDE